MHAGALVVVTVLALFSLHVHAKAVEQKLYNNGAWQKSGSGGPTWGQASWSWGGVGELLLSHWIVCVCCLQLPALHAILRVKHCVSQFPVRPVLDLSGRSSPVLAFANVRLYSATAVISKFEFLSFDLEHRRFLLPEGYETLCFSQSIICFLFLCHVGSSAKLKVAALPKHRFSPSPLAFLLDSSL